MRIKRNNLKPSKLPTKVKNGGLALQLGPDNDCVNVTFNATLRVPETGEYPLPPSLRLLPIRKVDDYKDKVPKKWLSQGGVFLPLYQREAVWLQFDVEGGQNKAMKVGLGMVNALNGKKWSNQLEKTKQDYCVVPKQRWIDGIASEGGKVKQFVAMPLGQGYTVESQVTGEDKFGGIQLMMMPSKNKTRVPISKPIAPKMPVYHPNPPPYAPHMPPNPLPSIPAPQPMLQSATIFPSPAMNHPPPSMKQMHSQSMMQSAMMPESAMMMDMLDTSYQPPPPQMKRKLSAPNKQQSQRARSMQSSAKELGISAGGTIKQKIHADTLGYNTWDQTKAARVFVHIVNSAMWTQITGEAPPPTPITAKTYESYGYPWFSLYDEDSKSIPISNTLSNIKSVSEIDKDKYGYSLGDNEEIPTKNVIHYGDQPKDSLDGEW